MNDDTITTKQVVGHFCRVPDSYCLARTLASYVKPRHTGRAVRWRMHKSHQLTRSGTVLTGQWTSGYLRADTRNNIQLQPRQWITDTYSGKSTDTSHKKKIGKTHSLEHICMRTSSAKVVGRSFSNGPNDISWLLTTVSGADCLHFGVSLQLRTTTVQLG